MRGAVSVGHNKDKRVESCQNVNILGHPRVHLPTLERVDLVGKAASWALHMPP